LACFNALLMNRRQRTRKMTIKPLPAAFVAGLLAGLILGVAGCTFQPSLIGQKAVDRFAAIVEEKVAQTPTPYIDVQAPPPEKIVDWPELLALAGMMLGGIAHRYYFHRKNAARA
jgi:hypothetical protein